MPWETCELRRVRDTWREEKGKRPMGVEGSERRVGEGTEEANRGKVEQLRDEGHMN